MPHDVGCDLGRHGPVRPLPVVDLGIQAYYMFDEHQANLKTGVKDRVCGLGRNQQGWSQVRSAAAWMVKPACERRDHICVAHQRTAAVSAIS